MATGGETGNHDAIWVDLELLRPGPNQLYGSPRIEQRRRHQVAVGAEPVAEHKGAKASRGEPICCLAGRLAGKLVISAAGHNDHGRAFAAAPA